MAAAVGGGKRSDAEGSGGDSAEEQSGVPKDDGSSQGDADSADEKRRESSSDAPLYPPQLMLTRSVIKTIVGGALGTKTLSEDDLRKVLYLGGLEDHSGRHPGHLYSRCWRAAWAVRHQQRVFLGAILPTAPVVKQVVSTTPQDCGSRSRLPPTQSPVLKGPDRAPQAARDVRGRPPVALLREGVRNALCGRQRERAEEALPA